MASCACAAVSDTSGDGSGAGEADVTDCCIVDGERECLAEPVPLLGRRRGISSAYKSTIDEGVEDCDSGNWSEKAEIADPSPFSVAIFLTVSIDFGKRSRKC